MRVLTLITLSISLAGWSAAQMPQASSNHELFVGTWVLNTKKSTERVLPDSADWTISIDGVEVRFLRELVENKKVRSYELIFHADGRGEINIIPVVRRSGATGIRSKTKWEKNVLVRRYAVTVMGIGPRGRELSDDAEATERYSLSKDADQMLLETTVYFHNVGVSSPRGKLVFDRKK